MSLEQTINYQLNKVPGIKKVIKRVYQRTMYTILPKIKSEGNITRISPDDTSHEYFFGYYDKSPWDISDRYILCMRANDTWSDVSPKEKADILLIDTLLPETDKNRVKKISETGSWNVQQSCMLQWLGQDFSSRIIFNDYRNGKYVAVIKEIKSGAENVIDAPVYTVSSDGKTALTLDFSRLYNLRPGYGYYNVPEKTKDLALPDATAVWKINLENGNVIPILTYKDFASFQPREEMKEEGSIHKVNHLMLNPSGTRCMVLYRWFVGQRKYTRLVTFNVDGSDMYVLSDDDMVSHCFWKDDEYILAFENKKEGGPGYYFMKDKTQKYIHCWPQLSNDGHPSYSPDRSMIVTDTYPDRARMAEIKLMDGTNEKNKGIRVIARVFAPFKYDNDTRCDLHPRWNHKGDLICFDSVFEGHRGLYLVSVPQKARKYKLNSIISVVIPVYNVEKYLERCVESVMNQTYNNLEVILVNDGSTDSSLDICKRLQAKYPQLIIIDKPNGGLSSARNAGIRASHGDYIAFLDSDDWVTTDCYEYMLSLAILNDADVSDVMIYQVKSENDQVPSAEEKIEVYSGRDILEHYMYRGMSEQNGAPYSACRKLYKRELLQDDTAAFIEGTVNEDICFNYRVLRKCSKIVVSNQIKYFYFQGEASITTGAMTKKDLALLTVSHDLVKLAEDSGDVKIIELAKMKEARSYFSLLARAARDGIDENSIDNPDKLVKELRIRLKKKIGLLLKSPMSSTRKVLAVAFVGNYKMSCKIIKILRL